MVELQHRAEPTPALTEYLAEHPAATVADFDSREFQRIKGKIRVDLNADQGGLCAYCEKLLPPQEGQIDHIKPKSTYRTLCFDYRNYAHSCFHEKTCGQKKKSGILPIEPAPGCNAEWTLSTNGRIEPRPSLTRQRRHAVTQTCDMLGLNREAALVDERRRWLQQSIDILQAAPDALPEFLQDKPYRHILATAF